MNALTKQLADALKKTQYDYSEGMCSCGAIRGHHAECEIGKALAAFDAAKDVPPVSGVQADMSKFDELAYGKWEEMCEIVRFGGTGQVLEAAKEAPEDDALTVAYMAGSASRLDELRAKDGEIAELRNKLDALQRRTSRHSLAKDLGSAVDGDAAIMARMTAKIAELRERLDAVRAAALAYEEYPVDAGDMPESWGLLGKLVAICRHLGE